MSNALTKIKASTHFQINISPIIDKMYKKFEFEKGSRDRNKKQGNK